MRTLVLLILFVVLGSCGSYSDLPLSQKDKGQLIVELDARARKGVNRGLGEGFNYKAIKNKKNKNNFQKVNYKKMPNIAVWLEGASLNARVVALKAVQLNVTDEGPDHRLLVIAVGASLNLMNSSSEKVCLYTQDDSSGFEADLKSGARATVKPGKVGVFHLYCEYNENIHVTLVVTPNHFAALGKGGSYVFFDQLPPGEYRLKVKAPRLPLWSEKVVVTAGQRLIREASLGVRQISKSKK
jgi:hypothetical protein